MRNAEASKMEFGGFRHGDIVWWKDEWASDERELATPFVCLEPADDGRCLITPLDRDFLGKGTMAGSQMVKLEWLRKDGGEVAA